jgi:ribonuclease-3
MNLKIKFLELEKKIGVNFKNKDLLIQAFVHRSYLNEHPHFQYSHNERFEFLGDAVLELIVTEYLFENFNVDEGELTNLRAALVRGESLASVARELRFEKYLFLSKGEQKNQGRAKEIILANAFEAFLGALYLDQGLEAVRIFLEKYLLPQAKVIFENNLHKDPKTTFQEYIQEKYKITPHYKVLEEKGPDHQKIFKVGVFVNSEKWAEGEGFSKQRAEEMAALRALEKIRLNSNENLV